MGNAAWSQRQNDVYGELLAAAYMLWHRIRLDQDQGLRPMLTEMADLAATVWSEPDHGIWEMRDEPRHHLHSKLMCWVALDRVVEMSPGLDEGDRVDHWRSKRDEIREVILERAWNDDVGAFTQSFGSSHLDAAALVIPIVGFLPPDDSRVSSTVRAIEADLTDESGLVARYRGPDGLRGDQGAFLLCTFWLAQAHALAGNTARAREVFTTAAGFANDLGLLSEEVDPGTGSLLGNFPQALSYIGLVNAAWAIGEAERSQG